MTPWQHAEIVSALEKQFGPYESLELISALKRALNPGPDPWELLREAMLAWNKQVNMSTFHDDVLDDWKACIAEWRRINEALKQHDAERKSK